MIQHLIGQTIRAMIDVGFIKAKNARSSNNKLRYAYILTPQGAAEKLFLTGAFLRGKMREFEALNVEIDALQSGAGAEVCRTYLHGQ
jgi:hypothetical protein